MAWLMVCLQALARPQSQGRYLAWLAAALGLTAAMCLIRSAGIAMAAGGCWALMLGSARTSRRDASAFSWQRLIVVVLVGMTAVLVVGAVILQERWASQPLGAATYLTSLAAKRDPALGDGFVPWFALVVSDIGRVTIPFMFKSYGNLGWWWDVNMLLYIPVVSLLAFGYFRWLRRSDDPLAWSLPFYLALVTYFRWNSGRLVAADDASVLSLPLVRPGALDAATRVVDRLLGGARRSGSGVLDRL